MGQTILGDAAWGIGAGELVEGVRLASASFQAGTIAYFTSEASLGSKMLAPISESFSLAAGAASLGADAKLASYTNGYSHDWLTNNPGSSPPEGLMDALPVVDLIPATMRFIDACFS